MKGIHGSIVALLIAACTPPSSPSSAKPATIEELRSKTVALVRVEDDGFGAFCSGVWVSENEILSANHCVDELQVGDWTRYATDTDVFVDGVLLRHTTVARGAWLKRRDEKHDLALLAAEPSPAHGIAKVSTQLVIGEPVQTMGQSLGLLWWSYSRGVISAVRTLPVELAEEDSTDPKMKWVQTTAPISPGNSGGALFDEHGDIIGVCHAHFPAGQNLNIFVHPEYVESFLRQ